jgi:FAD/FMN-containing dehydrogenase
VTDLESLAASLPPGAVLGPDEDLSAYEKPWRGETGRAAFVVRPGDLDQLRETVRWLVRARQPVVVQGANTGLVGASVPGGGGAVAVLSTERLTGPLDVHAADRAVTAGAGVLLSTLDERLAADGLELPVDLGADPSIGGIVATNAGGARVLRHGDVRHRLLGLEAVLLDDDATVVGDLRPLRKKNDTIRVADLLVGSAGLLAVVSAATFAVTARERERATAYLLMAGSLVEACRRLEVDLGARVGALELVSGTALAAAVRRLPDLPDPFPGRSVEVALLVEVTGPGAQDALVDALDRLGPLVSDAAVLPPERAWALRHGLSEALAREGTVLGLDVSVPRDQIEPVRREVALVVEDLVAGARLADFGHVGDGGLHLNVVLPATASPSDASALRRAVYAVVTRAGGSFSAEHGLGPMNVAWWLEHEPAPARSALAAVKRALDPYGLLGTEALRDAVTEGGRR